MIGDQIGASNADTEREGASGYGPLFLASADHRAPAPRPPSHDELERLSRLVQYAQSRAQADARANPAIPAGYVAFGQFVAHDTTDNQAPFAASAPAQAPSQNARHRPLVLDTLYGPDTDKPPAFAPEGLFLLGRVRRPTERVPGPNAPQLALRWRPRPAPEITPETPPDQRRCPLFADGRNDRNVVIHQLTVLFSVLHNAIFRRLDAAQPATSRFTLARALVTLTYRRIVFQDYLARLLDPAVWRYFEANGPLEPDPLGQRAIPQEYSHAIYRMGHAMVQPALPLRDGQPLPLAESRWQSSARIPPYLPLLERLTTQWGQYFPIADSTPEPTRCFGPSAIPFLGESLFFGNNDGPPAHNSAPSGARNLPLAGGLLYRDFARGAEVNLISPAQLCTHLASVLGPDFNPQRYYQQIRTHLSHWLAEDTRFLSARDKQILAQRPPLLLFAQIEARAEPTAGRHLGPAASLVVAETLYRAHARATAELEDNPALAATAAAIFPHGLPASMPALITQIAAWHPPEYGRLPII